MDWLHDQVDWLHSQLKGRKLVWAMSIRIKLSEDQVLVVRVDAGEWSKAYQKALDHNGMIEVHDGDRTLAINPRRVLFWEEIRDPDRAQTEGQPA
jgi:hypothetical protein